MTDNEIIKAFECCTGANCIECPFNGNDFICVDGLVRSAFDLIKRQQAEIEVQKRSLKNTLEQMREEKLHPYKLHYGNLRMEIAREVCDRLKAKASNSVMESNGIVIEATRSYTISKLEIDNLLEEMEKECEGKQA